MAVSKTDVMGIREMESPPSNNSRFDLQNFPQSDVLVNALNEIFSEQVHEDKTVLKAKEILGENYSLEEVKSLVSSFEYLITNWLEEYEKKVFNNMTIKELSQS